MALHRKFVVVDTRGPVPIHAERGDPPCAIDRVRIQNERDLEDGLNWPLRKAVEYIGKQKGMRRPFFLYMPLSAPHLPVVPDKEYEGSSKAGKYGDFVVEMDRTVGAVLKALEENGLAGNTLVCFSSDNGGLGTGGITRKPTTAPWEGSPIAERT